VSDLMADAKLRTNLLSMKMAAWHTRICTCLTVYFIGGVHKLIIKSGVQGR